MAYPRLHTLAGKVSASDINTGVNLLPANSGRVYRIVDMTLRAIGGNANATTVTLKTTASSPVTIITYALAALTQNTLVRAGASNTTLGAGWNASLGYGGAIQLKTSATESSATHYEYEIRYVSAAP